MFQMSSWRLSVSNERGDQSPHWARVAQVSGSAESALFVPLALAAVSKACGGTKPAWQERGDAVCLGVPVGVIKPAPLMLNLGLSKFEAVAHLPQTCSQLAVLRRISESLTVWRQALHFI